jgi:tetratricopeptide (TPR) repeat protein
MEKMIDVKSINSQVDIITTCIGIETMPLGIDRDIEIEELKSVFPQNRHVLFLAAKNAHKNNRLDMAKYFYLTALKHYPNDSKIWNNLGVLYKDHYKNKEEALKCFEKAIDINVSDSFVYTNLASLYADYFNDEEKAAANYLKSIEFDPQNPHAYLNYARLLVKYADNNIEKFLKAEKYYETAIKLDNEIAETYFNLANLQWANLKKYEEAKNNYLIAIQLKPDFYQAMVNLASLYLDVFEDSASAKIYYSKAQLIVPHLKIEEIEDKIAG